MCFAKSKQGARIKRRSEELIDAVEHLETCMRLVKYAKPTYTTTMKHCCLSTVSCKAWYIEVLLWQAGKRWGVKEEWKKSEEEWRGEDRKRLDEERRTWARRRDGEGAVSVMNQAGLKCSCLAKARTKLWKRKLAGRPKLKPRHLDFYIQMFSNLKLWENPNCKSIHVFLNAITESLRVHLDLVFLVILAWKDEKDILSVLQNKAFTQIYSHLNSLHCLNSEAATFGSLVLLAAQPLRRCCAVQGVVPSLAVHTLYTSFALEMTVLK